MELLKDEVIDVVPKTVVLEEVAEVVPEMAVLEGVVSVVNLDEFCNKFYCLQDTEFKVVMINLV